MMNKLFIDLHVVHTVPPSCINRDDTGSPKTAIYGGARRARVSSQCWKHAMRQHFRESFSESELGIRTKKIVDVVAEQIALIDSTVDARELAKGILGTTKIQLDKNEDAKALFFLSVGGARNLANLAIRGDATLKECNAALNSDRVVDIALFGRMVADDATLNADASAQVAHAISTHRVENEFDFFIGKDDRTTDEPGAAMMGSVEYNSSTLYRYATVAVHSLHSELGDINATARAVAEFARSFVLSMPKGKQNTFAANTPPDAVLVTLRTDRPVSFAGAYENPVLPDGGYAKGSIKRLVEYAGEVHGSFVAQPMACYTVGAGLDSIAPPISVETLALALKDKIESL